MESESNRVPKNREEDISRILRLTKSNRFSDIILSINKTRKAPESFFWYGNLCSADTQVHWDMENDELQNQSDRCIGFILDALKIFNK